VFGLSFGELVVLLLVAIVVHQVQLVHQAACLKEL